MRTQEEMMALLLNGLLPFYTNDEGGQVKGSIVAMIELLTNQLLSDDEKDKIIELMRQQDITGTEPHLLRADVCEYDRDLFAQYVLDGTAKERLYALNWYEVATHRKRPEGWKA